MVNRPNERILRAAHLSSEITTATEQLALGLNQAANPQWQARLPGAAFAQLSQGVERFLKLTFWLHEEDHGRLVDAKFGSGSGGHAIGELNGKVFDFLEVRSRGAGPYIQGLIAETREDPFWRSVLAALDSWSDASGRYRNLDALRGKTTQKDEPWVPWEEAETRAIAEDGGWADLTPERLEASRTRVLLSIMSWWHTLYRSWQHGLVGEEGKTFSSALDPQNLHLDESVAGLIAGR